MATQAPVAAFDLDVGRTESGEAVDAPPRTGNSATPGNESCPRLEFPQFSATHVLGTTRSRHGE